MQGGLHYLRARTEAIIRSVRIKGRANPAILCFTVGTWAAVASCGEAEVSDGQCEGDVIATMGPIASNETQTGFVQVIDSWDRTQDDQGQVKDIHVGRVQAGFADLSTVTSSAAQITTLSEVCVGVVSRPVRDGRAMPIAVTEVRVEGTARGTILASRAGPGTHIAVGSSILGDGQGTLRFVVTATGAPGLEIDQMMPSLRGTVVLSEPDVARPADLTTDRYPLRWTSAGADWVTISVRPLGADVEDGGQVICRVADTGCFDLPVAATNFLLASNRSQYSMTVQLHRYSSIEPSADTLVEVEAIAETRLTIDNGVIR